MFPEAYRSIGLPCHLDPQTQGAESAHPPPHTASELLPGPDPLHYTVRKSLSPKGLRTFSSEEFELTRRMLGADRAISVEAEHPTELFVGHLHDPDGAERRQGLADSF